MALRFYKRVKMRFLIHRRWGIDSCVFQFCLNRVKQNFPYNSSVCAWVIVLCVCSVHNDQRGKISWMFGNQLGMWILGIDTWIGTRSLSDWGKPWTKLITSCDAHDRSPPAYHPTFSKPFTFLGLSSCMLWWYVVESWNARNSVSRDFIQLVRNNKTNFRSICTNKAGFFHVVKYFNNYSKGKQSMTKLSTRKSRHFEPRGGAKFDDPYTEIADLSRLLKIFDNMLPKILSILLLWLHELQHS